VKATQIPETTRHMLAARCARLCEVCWAEPFTDAHHRQPRGMGGTMLKTKHRLSNLIAVGRACHRRIESDRAEAFKNGWLVSQYDDPATVPVKLHTATLYGASKLLLLDNGDYTVLYEDVVA
jgi:5-methylcytosine-specific restriction protein A